MTSFRKLPERFSKVSALLCVLLITFSGFAQAIHVHPEDSKVPGHECSVCSVVHSGVIGSAVYRPIPILVRSPLVNSPVVARWSAPHVDVLRIRPPPAV